jgi:NAD(P)-dependent dehydrogenase (short-subunit alcohol dehydrogenase family)
VTGGRGAGRSVVVTGCGMGLGRAILERLTADGWVTVGIEWDADRAADARALPGVGDVIAGDAADRAVLARTSARARELAPLGGWVNNAAIGRMGTLHAPVPTDVDETIRVNLMGPYWGCSEAVRAFLDQGSPGAIVNISSIHARAAFNGFAAYDVAKGGISALTRYVAVEYGPAGIRCNAIEPGAIRTAMNQSVIDRSPDPGKAAHEMAALHPLGRMGEPPEIGAVAAFLLSDDASFLSGECIAVDGAATARCYPYDPDPAIVRD